MHCRIRTDGMLELRRAGCDFYVQRCPERPIQGPDQLCGDWCPRLLENNNTNGDAETVTLSCVHSAPVFMVAEDLRAEEIRRIKDDPGDEA